MAASPPLYAALLDPRSRDMTRGFLPPEDPLVRLPEPFAVWEETAGALSKLALTRHIRPAIERLPSFPVKHLRTLREYERAMTMLSYMGSLYVLAPDHPIAAALPENLATAWHGVASRLGRPPMLTYSSQALYNWRRINPGGPVAVGNLVLIQNFLGGMDEEWFVTIHITIEAEAGQALSVLLPAQEAVVRDDAPALEACLLRVADTLQVIEGLLRRMPERCDPDIYYRRVRPYMFGWKHNPDFPDGMLYRGVRAYGGRPQRFRGETGAQSSVIYALDGLLGVAHEFDEMRAYLMEMRDYMPVQDRAFIETIEQGPSVRAYVLQRAAQHPSLRDAYNACIRRLYDFRCLHMEYAALYIIKPSHHEKKGEVGTGGTPFTVYLKKHIDETLAHAIG